MEDFFSEAGKLNLALNILRPSNDVIMYDDNQNACLYYNVQSGGSVKYPSWNMLEMVPSAQYGGTKQGFNEWVHRASNLTVPIMYAGYDKDSNELLLANKPISRNSYIQQGGNALAGNPYYEHLSQNLEQIQNGLKNNVGTIDNRDTMTNIVTEAREFADASSANINNLFSFDDTHSDAGSDFGEDLTFTDLRATEQAGGANEQADEQQKGGDKDLVVYDEPVDFGVDSSDIDTLGFEWDSEE